MNRFIVFCFFSLITAVQAQNPQLTSWFTANSGKYARIYASTADETAGTKSTTWTRGTTTQASPAYSGVTEINYSANWVYIRTTGLASYTMGPWPTNFPSFPTNTATVYRIPRVPTIPTTKTGTGLGATGRMVNGVAIYDSRDAFSYSTANSADARPNTAFTGDGIWNRDGDHNEGPTFDPALAHQAGGTYHNHGQPIGLRFQLGDHVDYNATTNRYTESTTPVTQHSPIVGWAQDGLPVYGPYGYSDPDSASSGVRRMVSGFALRDGTNGTTAITTRVVLPAWAQRVQNKPTLTAAQYGPAVNTTYLIGHYIEDFDYQGDLAGRVQTKGSNSVGGFVLGNYDLNEQNVRFCVTPEFPAGTWAYFTTINADNSPAFPYTTGRQFYGNATGGSTTEAVMNADTPLTRHFIGGANTPITVNASVSAPNVTLTWSAVEGGTYSAEASTNQTSWTPKTSGIVATGTSANTSYATLSSTGTEYGRVNRTALATFDTNGQVPATVSQTGLTSFLLSGTVSAPTITTPTSASITGGSATLGGNITSDGGALVSASGVVVALTSVNSNPIIGGSGVTNITGTATLGVFTVNATGLATNSTYTFKAYATNSQGTIYSTAGTFTTLTANLPTITSPTVTNILNTSAALGGNVTSDGGAAISARGVVWSLNGTNNNPLIGGSGVTNVTGTGTTGVFTVSATGFTTPAPQTIAFKAYATNAAGTVYTNVTTFQTVTLSSLSNLVLSAGALTPTFASNTLAYTASVPNSVSSITVTPSMVIGTATVTVNTVTVTPGTASGPIALNVGTNTLTVVGTQTTPASTRTYTVTVTRAAPSAPLIASPTSASITATSATLGGNVTSDGGSAITARGVVFAPTATNSNPQIGGGGVTNVAGTGTTGVFTVNATSLTSGTAYSFAAYATNSLGTIYTTPVSTFLTPNLSGDLSNLVISAGTLAPTFSSAITSYTASVSNATSSINVTPTALVGTSTITVNTVPVSSGSPSAVALSIGSNLVDIVVTGLDSTVKTYSVTVTRASGNPIVTSPTATGLSTTTATLGGNVTNDGGTTIIARGIVLAPTATNSNPQLGGTGVTNLTASGTTGVFTVSATGLTLGASYTYAAYATNSAGTGYSVTGTFTTPRNNILLIIADDFGTDACKLYNPGGNNASTPNIDSLAANGVRFNNAYAYAVCSPTRSCIITGRYGFRTGTGDVITPNSGSPLQASEFTLPEAFTANASFNYQLKHLGKYHLVNGSNQAAQMSPVTVAGWPSYAGGLSAEVADYYNWTKVVTDGTAAGTSSTTTTTYATTDTVNDAVAFINAQTAAGKPWFSWVALNAPHFPFHKPPTSLLTTQAYIDLSGSAGDITANRISYFNAAVQAMDTEIGRLLASVDLNVTTVIFIGDNGTDSQVAQSPYSSTKSKDSLYEGGVRVPMIIRGPNVVSPGRTSNTLVHAVDLYSTILELAGINVATTTAGVTLDSQSLLPVLQNQAVTRPLAYSELFDTATPTSGGEELRDSRYKIIRFNTGITEFYDLQVDPYEATNLIASGVGALTEAQRTAYYLLLADLGTYSNTAPTTINSVTLNPITPTNGDNVAVTANITPASGSTLSSANLTYSSGSQITTVPFREVWSNGSTASGLAGANNAWIATATRNVSDVKQRSAQVNRTTPIVLTNCITNGTTSVTCTSTTGIGAGMNIAGPTIAGGTTIASVTNSTTFVLSTAATGSGTNSLTVAGVTLTGCSLVASPTIQCASTAGLAVGMRLAGVTSSVLIPLVVSIDPNGTQFTASGTITAVTSTITASGSGLEFAAGTSNSTDTMATLTNPINASGAVSGTVDFFVRTNAFVASNGWTFQVSPDGGSTWVTRASETYASTTAANCSLTATNATINTANTSGLSIGSSVQGTSVTVTNCTTDNVTNPTVVATTSSTAALAVGMYVTGTGIPNNTRITAITASSFTMSASATAAGTITVTANYLAANATITAINPGVSFTVSTAPQLTASGITLFAGNHNFLAQSYALAPSELTSNLKMRFQFTGQATGGGSVNVDDISVTLVSGNPPVTLAMTSAGSGNYTATIPGQTTGTTVSYSILATDSTSGIDYNAASYTVIAGSPVLNVTPATGLASSGTQGSGAFSPTSQIYTLSNTGTGSMTWTASKTQTWLILSATGGTLAAGASANVTASINTTNANALSVGSFTDTITFANISGSTGNTTRSASLVIGSNSLPATPAITALPAYSQGTARSIRWPAIAGATNYTLQISTTSNFATVLSSQTLSTPTGSFSNLVHGTTYYYRVLATNGVGSSSYSPVVSSTQDNVSPVVAITSPSSAQTTATNTITLSGTSSDALSGLSKVTVNGATATTSNNFATWTITTPLGFGTNSLTALAIDNAGNTISSTPLLVTLTTAQSFNPLIIPDTITGTTFNLALKPKTKQFLSGTATTTNAYNDMLYGAPTLIMNKGDWVQMNVTNNLAADTTTTHWHGFHIPAIMDGGPHQVIPAGTTWSPSWLVMNHAATYWYHPHLHEKTQEQVSRGGVGMIIIRDEIESALTLPRNYGVDDIPLALGSRRFTTNQIVTVNSAYGDTMLVNGVINPQVSLPKQYVRLRILNAEIERSLNLGFSDNRTFWVIASDGGLLDAPVATTRVLLAVGERAEILVDLTNDTLGGFINLMAYNNSASLGTALAASWPGGEPQTTGQFGSLLNNIDFNILRINIAAQTASPVLTRPTTLTANALWTNADVTNPTTRVINITGGAPGVFFFNTDQLFSPTVFNQTINYNAVERWTITNTSGFSHSFHIHDVEFAMISRVATGGGNVVTGLFPYEVGWKDTLYVQRNSSVTFIAKFDHFASNTNPYMYHCHFANHEDEGLMGQFVVVNNAVEDLAVASFTRYGNNNLISIDFKSTPGTTYTLQWSPDLSTWSDVGSVTGDGNSANFTETNQTRLSGTKGFYRVKLPTIISP